MPNPIPARLLISVIASAIPTFIAFAQISSAHVSEQSRGILNLLPMPQTVKWTDSGECHPSEAEVHFVTVDSIAEAGTHQQEAYRLKLTPGHATITAVTPTGHYRGLQTLHQLAPTTPSLDITDWAAFPVRGIMMDAGRTFIPMDELKREIDLLSRFKINVYHWHLTENQAWRLESKIYPCLNDSAITTRMPGKFYTLDDARELSRYARERHVTLIPEIDMPGHSAAFKRAMGFDMQSPQGIAALKELLTEACSAFPDEPYIHIGTDEVKFTNPDFVPEIISHIKSLGKQVISWNPGWEYHPGEIAMTQMWSYRGKPTDGIPAIDSRFHYINHFDTFADIVALYRSNIYNREEADSTIVGTIIGVWNDRYVDDPNQIVSQNGLYAHALAMGERAWRGGGSEYFDGLGTNLSPADTIGFADFADFERRLLHHKHTTLNDVPIPYTKQTHIHWRITEAFPNGGDTAMAFPPEQQEPSPEYQYNGETYSTRDATGAGIYLRHVWGTLVPGFYADPKPNHTSYAYTWVYSPSQCTVGINAEFQNYSRSETDLAPQQGMWDVKGSRIWINDKEITPPEWTSSHTVKDNEMPLGNENFCARQPIPVTLHQGWNKVLLKLPVGQFTTDRVRLVKWMFTLFFTPDDGLIFSPDRKLP